MSDRRIAIFLTGGTIDSLGASTVDHAWYTEASQRLEPGELLATVPELDDVATIEIHAGSRTPSYRMTSGDWLALARRIRARIDKGGLAGVVITHGTNTLEETAFFLDLIHAGPVPIVVTGALRPARSVGSDGPINLLRSVQVASAPQSRNRGVLGVFNDTIHAAQHLSKGSTFRVDAFGSRDAGPFGYVEANGEVRFTWDAGRPAGGGAFDLGQVGDDLPRVDVVVSHIDADAVHVDASLRAGARGLVVAGTGAGRPTSAQDTALTEAIDAGVLVCLTTRASGGRVLRSPRMTASHFLTGGDLPPWKAKIVLQLSISAGLDVDAVQKLFDSI